MSALFGRIKAVLMRWTRAEALSLGVCRQCGRDANFRDWTDREADEYQFSALCPDCSLPDDDCE